jgi:thiol-disulfide isomerase/thioredoxin
MKKLILYIFLFICLNSITNAKESNFKKDYFLKVQKEGKIVVVNSWNKVCTTCAAQVIVLNEAKKKFEDVIFLSFEQTVDKDVAEFLKIDYWTTIVIYKDNKEISRSIGQIKQEIIYSEIEKSLL